MDASSHYSLLEGVNGIVLKNKIDKVAIVIGGGSGHEPLFLGFVGEGLADGVAIGNVFAAPPPNTVHEVAKAVDPENTAMNSLSVQQTCNMFLFVGAQVIKNKEFLTEIDGAIGDGDHGIGMSVGFTSAIKKLKKSEFPSINDIFRSIGMAMLNSMGGASGVIFGTMFMGGVKSLPPTDCLNLDALTILMENSLQAIKDRGKASLGDKTMVDALEPAAITLREHITLVYQVAC